MDDNDDNSSSSSNQRLHTKMEEYQDLPFDSTRKDGDQSTYAKESSGHGRSHDDIFKTPDVGAVSSRPLKLKPEKESCIDDTLCSQNAAAAQTVPSSMQEVSASATSSSLLIIPHRGSLRRILNSSSFHAGQSAIPRQSFGREHKQSQLAPSSWPMYAINVASDCSTSQYSHSNTHPQKECYQLIFDRQQYEFCTRLFALLDIDSQSFIGPDSIREFVLLYFPVVRRRDDAIFASQCSDADSERRKESLPSPTFDEIWERTVDSEPHCTTHSNASISTIHKIGVEGWMVFCRLLALAYHQESKRRFASRHLQQMMRHKHGRGGSANTRINSNEVVVVVDNPPPGPPSLISIRDLVDVEQERSTSHNGECVEGWPFCPLPLPHLDLDQWLVSMHHANQKSFRPRGWVSVEPFSSSHEGDFILHYHRNGSKIVVRRSHADFEWLNAILELNKRPGQGQLCGRILPPFPSKISMSKESSQTIGARRQTDISEKALAAAKSGMGIIRSVWSEYVGLAMSSSPPSLISKNKTGQSVNMLSPKKSCFSKPEDVIIEIAHRMERYLNYLLENDALSTSFPLQAMLQASQTGLESAKQTLQDHCKYKKRHRLNSVTRTRTGVHSAASIFSALVSKTSSSLMHIQEDGENDKPWLRAAAQVAMTLQFHGILETTGHESSSARIQHASLPKFCNHRAGSWEEEENDHDKIIGNQKTSCLGSSESDSPKNEANFEAGVINVESELTNEQGLAGYDMLPSPGPSEEHRVLNAGSDISSKGDASKQIRSRFVYDVSSEQSRGLNADSDVDQLRDIIRSIHQKLINLSLSCAVLRSAQDERNAIQLSLLRDIDSWGDSGEIIIQRDLVIGVASLEPLMSAIEGSNKTMADDLMWQSLLAFSAVGAVTEVRDAVRASHTASRAKGSAFVAAHKAKKTYESCDRASSKEKIQQSQTEAYNTQSHAIHATVVEYEANIAKQRSAVSLAQDVKSWNIHRKGKLAQTFIEVAKSQQEACRKSADAWESLRDGLIDSSGCSFANDEFLRAKPISMPQLNTAPATLSSPINTPNFDLDVSIDDDFIRDDFDGGWENEQRDFSEAVAEATKSTSSVSEEFTDVDVLKESQQSEMVGSSEHAQRRAPPNISNLDEDYFLFHQDIVEGANCDSDKNEQHHPSSIHEYFHSGHGAASEDLPNRDAMTTSMQSLIDGLMAWGEEGNDEKEYQTDNIMGTSNDIQHNGSLLE